jgi:hypothetical protein
MRLDESGRWVPVLPEPAETTPADEPADRPPTPDDQRHADAGPE